MAVIQEAFFIPDDIAVGLASGIYKRFGGVVRWAVGSQKGQIVKHLKPIPVRNAASAANAVSVTATKSLSQRAMEFGAKHKTGLIITGIATGAAAIGGGIYYGVKTHKRKQFQNAFHAYIEAIRHGTLTVEIIENLEGTLSEVKTVKMSADELFVLVNHIRDYTLKLAEDNDVDMNIRPSDEPIIDLQKYLQAQKKILRAA